ncbi:Na+/H+ antiporter subunit A [Bacillus subtilis subsp. subtilis]|uniref:Na(+)/H(+) antiporter subunit A n=6 Tax=Bacilli TaxID=91061 RepID=MRPA_BACSU|nr:MULTISPECIES: Na+/H+ antiporter subunit A [Bacillales]NP_391038.2 sodium transporter component of a Na+/H+ antiporter [Bacillus subtilis subsp. subtilis str. 168]Q9K2S2.2 RecName: Full=Na(+)/H(+) antiporter subunit A; AltName: Full=Mrp complex subunit A; AltName: Full=Multiple resistance and pH homeostasis protein A [Bacillus subtilis subsp. subtilis str. 168]BAM55230.1 monovalent cation/H+ antiporter subunit A [Bacillus subtilis BEST7613]AFQ59006.1 Sodium transporter component of a Na+/H+an
MQLLHLAILSPFLFAFIIPFLAKYAKRVHTGWFVLILPVLLFIYFLPMIRMTQSGETLRSVLEWIPSLGINFTVYIDGLGLLFALLITGIGSLVTLYSIFYLSKEKEQLGPFYVYLLMFMGAMLGVVLVDNVMVLYMFWELTSLSSFLLIGYWYKREKSRYGAAKSLLITVSGGLCMLGGFILLYLITDSFSIREMVHQVQLIAGHELFIPAMILILLGAFTKSAQFPFYIWLPDAMEAPTPVSAYLHSATMVKAGIYVIARFSPIFAFSAQWFWIVSLVGLFTMVWGSFHAVKQTDLKSILAFSTVSQLGMIISMLGVSAAALHYGHTEYYTVAAMAAIFHLINHATFKGSLFMAVGIIDHETGTRDIRKLGGLMAIMPITFTISLIGTFSMAGLPPFNGFLSKEMFFTSMLRVTHFDLFNVQTWGVLFPLFAWIGSVFTFIYSMKLLFKTFRGNYQPEQLEKQAHEAPVGMLVPPVILVALAVSLFFFPNILSYSLIEPAMNSIYPTLLDGHEKFHVHISQWHGVTTELLMTAGIVVIGTIGYLSLNKWKGIYKLFPSKLTLNRLYDKLLTMMEKGSYRVTKQYMTGFLRDYLLYIFAGFIILIGGAFAIKGGFSFKTEGMAKIGVYEIILTLVMISATVATVFARSRLTAIIALGVVGYTLALFFVIFRAPDLALTQLVIETISVALFLLCFYHLPKLRLKTKTRTFRMTNFIISLGVGVIVTLLGIASSSQRTKDSIASFFVKHSHDLGGGDNVVNVILVDFRGFDTMFEITVLTIAALGIYSMIKTKVKEEGKSGE